MHRSRAPIAQQVLWSEKLGGSTNKCSLGQRIRGGEVNNRRSLQLMGSYRCGGDNASASVYLTRNVWQWTGSTVGGGGRSSSRNYRQCVDTAGVAELKRLAYGTTAV